MSSSPVSADTPSSSEAAFAPAFRCSTRDRGRKAAWVHVAGELDLAAAPLLERTLHQASKRARLVVLDLRDLTRADSSGVGVIVEASASARRSGRRLTLVRGLSQVDRLLALTGASNAVEIVDLAAGEPAIQALLHIARKDRADARARRRGARGVVTFLSANQLTRGVDALAARGVQRES